MSYWIFKCNPDKYRLPERLKDPNDVITWTVVQHKDEIKAGDTVFLWATGPERGIRAALRIEDDPRVRAELESEQPYLNERDTKERLRVLCKLIKRNLNLGPTQLRNVKGLEQLSVFHGFQQCTNFAVTPGEGEILLDLMDRRDDLSSAL